MRVLIFLCVLAVFALAQKTPEEQWVEFKTKHGKNYLTAMEHDARFEVFKANLIKIDDLNKRSDDAKFGVNQFADLTPSEFRNLYRSKTPATRPSNVPVAPEIKVGDLPDTFDWREKGAVTPVKNQGQCGSCWSFSTVANVEGQWFLSGHSLTSLSEQNLVDCDHECMTFEGQQSCDQGCNGGLQPNAYNYIIKNGGIDTEASYGYEAKDGACRFNPSNVGAKISNWTMVSTDETQIAAFLMQNGPLAVAADAAEWQFYLGGVFTLPCGTSLDHGIAIVGWSHKKTIFGKEYSYWIVKNSWGPSWGEAGYIYIEKGVGKCGINTFVSSALMH